MTLVSSSRVNHNVPLVSSLILIVLQIWTIDIIMLLVTCSWLEGL